MNPSLPALLSFPFIPPGNGTFIRRLSSPCLTNLDCLEYTITMSYRSSALSEKTKLPLCGLLLAVPAPESG